MWFHCFIVNNTHFTSWNLVFHWFIVNSTHFTSWNLVFHRFIVNNTHYPSWNWTRYSIDVLLITRLSRLGIWDSIDLLFATPFSHIGTWNSINLLFVTPLFRLGTWYSIDFIFFPLYIFRRGSTGGDFYCCGRLWSRPFLVDCIFSIFNWILYIFRQWDILLKRTIYEMSYSSILYVFSKCNKIIYTLHIGSWKSNIFQRLK